MDKAIESYIKKTLKQFDSSMIISVINNQIFQGKTSKNREEILKKVVKEIENKNYNIKKQDSFTSGETTIRSSSGVYVITHNNKKYALVLTPNFKLEPQEFTTTRNWNSKKDFIKSIQNGLKKSEMDIRYLQLLESLILKASNGLGIRINKFSGKFSNFKFVKNTDIDRFFINMVNKQFSEVMGVIVCANYFESQKMTIKNIHLPEKNQRGYDFSIEATDRFGNDKIYKFSVKTRHGLSNTLKPDFLNELIQGAIDKKTLSAKSRKYKDEIKLLQALDSLKAKSGKKLLYEQATLTKEDLSKNKTAANLKEYEELVKKNQYLKKIKNDKISQAKKNLTEETKKMKFTELAGTIMPEQISFFKFEYKETSKTAEYDILMDQQLKSLLKLIEKSFSERLYLRDKGNKDKLGLTPP